MIYKILTLNIFCFVLSATAAAGELRLTGQIFPLKGAQTTPIFEFRSEAEVKDGRYVMTGTFTARDGSVALIERTELEGDNDQGRLLKYTSEQKQLGSLGVLEIKDGKAHFTYTIDGKTKTDDEKLSDNFVVGPTLVRHMRAHWSELMAGGKLRLRFAVIDRRESVGFEFSKEREVEINGKKLVVIKMRPSSFVISALVDPLHFYMQPDGSNLDRLEGRTPLKLKEGEKFKDLDALTVYKSFAPAAAPGSAATPSPVSGGASK